MLNNVRELITQTAKAIEPAPEELQICKALIQDKLNEVVRLQEEISLLQEFLINRQSNSAALNSSSDGQAFSQCQ
jgi:hypothetical protein